MFNIFKRSKQQNNNGNVPRKVEVVKRVVIDFVGFIADIYQPGLIYDVSILPYKKEYIKIACNRNDG